MRLFAAVIFSVLAFWPAFVSAQCDPTTAEQDFFLLGTAGVGADNQPDPVNLAFDSTVSDPADSTAFSLETGFAHNAQAIVSADLATGKLAYFMSTLPAPNSLAEVSVNMADRVCFDLPSGMPTADIQLVMNITGSVVCANGGFSCTDNRVSELLLGPDSVSVPFWDLNLPAHQLILNATVTQGEVYLFEARTAAYLFGGYTVDFSNTLDVQFILPPGVSFQSASGVLLSATGGTGSGSGTQLHNSNPSAARYFGYSVAIDADTAVIGAPDGATANNHSAYVFTRDNNVWTEQARLTGNGGFGYAVAIDGDTLVVGAPQECQQDNGTENCGFAYVFTRSNDVWTEQAKLIASDADDSGLGDFFGGTVALDGDTIIVGARLEDITGEQEGAAYVFTRSNDEWTEQTKLTASDAAPGDQFAAAVAVDSDTAVIGAPDDDDGGDNSGAAYVFTRSGGVWTEQPKLIASDAAAEDSFGISVALDGDTAVIGAYHDDDTASDSGAAYVFTGNGAAWIQQAKLTASDADSEDFFGRSVSIHADTVVIGALGDDDAGNSSGSAYVFARSVGIWSPREKLTASDAASFDSFGQSVAIRGGTALIGAYQNVPSGSAYVFSPVPLPDDDGDRVPNAIDLCAGTNGNVPVDANGCSDAQVDSDDDGYCNPGAVSVGPSGCSGTDVFPGDPDEWADNDIDGIGDNADPDDDNDGIVDVLDPRPLDYDNGCTGGDVYTATLGIEVDSDRICAARVSIDVEDTTTVMAPDGNLTLIAPAVKLASGTTVAGRLSVISADPCPGCAPPPIYEIGDIGPAGGVVFYVTDNGTHGLEAAPKDPGEINYKWGCYGTLVGADGTAVGTGAENTAKIIAACPEAGTAARLSDSYELNGYDDWFLPSRDELNLMYLNIGPGGTENLGDFTLYYHWSSSEWGAFEGQKQHFDTGLQGSVRKDLTNLFRAVRAF